MNAKMMIIDNIYNIFIIRINDKKDIKGKTIK
jgi:hypothetical protein